MKLCPIYFLVWLFFSKSNQTSYSLTLSPNIKLLFKKKKKKEAVKKEIPTIKRCFGFLIYSDVWKLSLGGHGVFLVWQERNNKVLKGNQMAPGLWLIRLKSLNMKLEWRLLKLISSILLLSKPYDGTIRIYGVTCWKPKSCDSHRYSWIHEIIRLEIRIVLFCSMDLKVGSLQHISLAK